MVLQGMCMWESAPAWARGPTLPLFLSQSWVVTWPESPPWACVPTSIQ